MCNKVALALCCVNSKVPLTSSYVHIYKAGIPLSVLRSFDFEVQASLYEAKINCSTEAANLTACSISLSPTSKLKAQQAGIRCFQTGILYTKELNTKYLQIKNF